MLFALCFGFAFFRFAADLCAGLSESTRCAGAAEGPTFASALVVDGCYLCSCVRVRACESRVWPVDKSARGVDVMFCCSRSVSALVRSCGAVRGVRRDVTVYCRVRSSAREHDSLIFMYFVPILARFVLCLCDHVRR